jgi:3'-phosphoadenosine 5'-phosphosulfate (PAPS) 3'-phosphatase
LCHKLLTLSPLQNRTHWAVEGRGAWLREGDAADTRLQCATFRDSDAGLVIVGSASHNTPDTQAFVADYASPKFTQLGSSLKLLLVAEGAAHVYPRLAPTCEWDTAAAHAVVLEAGGTVLAAGECDSKGVLLPGVAWRDALAQQRSVVYNKPNALNPFFVVYGKRIKD